MLRDGARSILEHTYIEIRDQVIEKSNLGDRVLLWSIFLVNVNYNNYNNDNIIAITQFLK